MVPKEDKMDVDSVVVVVAVVEKQPKVVKKKKVADKVEDKGTEKKLKVKATIKKSISKFGKIGQKKETPPEGDPLRKFYTSLLLQNKNSQMALKWCLEHGLLSDEETNMAVIMLGISDMKI